MEVSQFKDIAGDSGKSFGVAGEPLSKEIRDGIVGCNLENCKLAGTQSNQRAAAATSWIVYNSGTKFASAHMAWTGQGCSTVLVRSTVTVITLVSVSGITENHYPTVKCSKSPFG